MAYDLSIVQSTPYAVVVSVEDGGAWQRDVEFVCVTPNQTQAGSRDVEDRTPWEGEGEKGGAWRAGPGVLGVAGAAVVGVLVFL